MAPLPSDGTENLSGQGLAGKTGHGQIDGTFVHIRYRPVDENSPPLLAYWHAAIVAHVAVTFIGLVTTAFLWKYNPTYQLKLLHKVRLIGQTIPKCRACKQTKCPSLIQMTRKAHGCA